MRILETNHTLILDGHTKLKSGVEYVVSDHVAGLVMSKYGFATKSNYDIGDRYKPPAHDYDYTGKKLLVWRTGGIGDLLFITASLNYILGAYEGVKIKLACSNKYSQLWQGHPLLSDGRSHDMPFHSDLLEWADVHVHFEGLIEGGGRAEKVHAVDLFAEKFGISDKMLFSDKRPILCPTADIDNKARNILKHKLGVPDDGTPLVAIQLRASSPIRTFPVRRMLSIIEKLLSDGVHVLIMDSPNKAKEIENMILPLGKGVYNAAREIKNIRDTIAIIKRIDLLVAPDSSLTHIAGAIGVDKPTLALYGPFPSTLRTKYYPKCIALNCEYGPNGICPGAPCFMHGHDPCPSAKAMNTGNESPCFTSIKNKVILALINKMLGRT